MLFEFVIPLLAMAAGGFLLYRGVRKLDSPPAVFSGKAHRGDMILATLEGKPAVYRRVVLERFSYGGWELVAQSETRAAFYAGDILVNPEFADFDIAPRVFEGEIQHERGLLEPVLSAATARTGKLSLARELASLDKKAVPEGRLLPEGVLSALRSLKEFRVLLERNGRRRLRATEYAVPEGAVIHVGGGRKDGAALSGVLESRLLISDSASAGDIHRERAILGIAVGGSLVLLSLFVLYLISA